MYISKAPSSPCITVQEHQDLRVPLFVSSHFNRIADDLTIKSDACQSTESWNCSSLCILLRLVVSLVSAVATLDTFPTTASNWFRGIHARKLLGTKCFAAESSMGRVLRAHDNQFAVWHLACSTSISRCVVLRHTAPTFTASRQTFNDVVMPGSTSPGRVRRSSPPRLFPQMQSCKPPFSSFSPMIRVRNMRE
jgi:hypothetical protein